MPAEHVCSSGDKLAGGVSVLPWESQEAGPGSQAWQREPLLSEPACLFAHYHNSYTKSRKHEVLVSVFPL